MEYILKNPLNLYIHHTKCETRLRSTLKKLYWSLPYIHNLTLPYRVSVTTIANDICMPWYFVVMVFFLYLNTT